MKNLRPFEHDRPDLEPTKPANHEQTIWSAGFWEGEGSIATNSNGHSFVIVAGQKYPPCIERLKRWWGGKITIIKQNGAPFYTWQVCSYRAVDFVNAVWPYLSPQRKAQITEKLQKLTSHLRQALSDEIYNHIFSRSNT